MKTAFVTGATGFIGFHVASVLIQNGWKVRAIHRSGSRHPLMNTIDVEWRTGDIRNRDQVIAASAGCSALFHVAADYRLWARNPRELYDNNVKGTENVLEAALLNRVEKVVYTSSVGALGHNTDGTPASEATKGNLAEMVGHYKRSKYLAERAAERFIDRGLPLVIVHPSTPVGPADHKPTPTGKIIVDYLNGRMPAYLDTGLNFIDVRDVARGHLLALNVGVIGEKYILGNQNLTLSELFRILESVSGVKAPTIRLPYKPLLRLAEVCEVIARITGREPFIPLEGVRMAARYMFFDPGKAIRELGLPQTPISDALRAAVTWFCENNYCKSSRVHEHVGMKRV